MFKMSLMFLYIPNRFAYVCTNHVRILTKGLARKFQVAKRAMEWAMLVVSFKDRIINEKMSKIRRTLKMFYCANKWSRSGSHRDANIITRDFYDTWHYWQYPLLSFIRSIRWFYHYLLLVWRFNYNEPSLFT